jgi:hypothetical protein
MQVCKLFTIVTALFIIWFIYGLIIMANNRMKFFLPKQTFTALTFIIILILSIALLYIKEDILPIELAKVTIPILVAIMSFTLKNDIYAYKFYKIFIKEIHDIKRHLISGSEVLSSIHKDLSANNKPHKVHFDNLFIPEDLSLIKNRDQTSVDIIENTNLMRIRLELRNINNVAKYMSDFVDSPNYKEEDLKTIIEWELIRYFKKIIIFDYLDTVSLKFPDKKEIKNHIDNMSLDNKIYQETYSIYYQVFKKNRQEFKKQLNNITKSIRFV